MRSRYILLVVAAMAAVGATAGHAAEDRLRIEVFPRFTAAPAAVRVRATVVRDEKNRSLEVVADGGSYYRSSLIPLDGADAAMVNEMMFTNLPAGRYSVTVVLTDTTGNAARRSSDVVVTGNFDR